MWGVETCKKNVRYDKAMDGAWRRSFGDVEELAED